jgi:hypothetical protein
MEKIEFNTGRKYATNGQPIVAVRFGETVIFKDEARLIVGTFELSAGQPLSQSAVMRAYDNYGYHMAAWKKEYEASPEPVAEPEPVKTMGQPAKFFEHNPTLLATFGGYRLYEHPLRGDTAPVYMSTPSGALINTGFYDLGDWAFYDLGDNNPEGLALCREIERGF